MRVFGITGAVGRKPTVPTSIVAVSPESEKISTATKHPSSLRL
jgi:hypothetical protein